MSRIGNTSIQIPSSVQVNLENMVVHVKGPKGELTQTLHPLVKVSLEDNSIKVTRKNDTKPARSMHGTYQRLINNMVVGVDAGYKKTLELVGTGYRVQKQGKKIVLSLGLSHPVEYEAPENVAIDIEGNNKIFVSGINKQEVGQVAAEIRAFRPPEPYKGKGIRYEDEVVRRKAGKAAKAAG